MNREESVRNIRHEMVEFFSIFIFLAPFFLSVSIYRMYIERESGQVYFHCGAALVNALILSKIILIGEAAGLGRGSERRALLLSTIYKSFVFAVFYMAFYVLEEAVHAAWHDQRLGGALAKAVVYQRGELLSHFGFLFFAFIPFFALREIRRVLGVEEFRSLLLGRRRPPVEGPTLRRTA